MNSNIWIPLVGVVIAVLYQRRRIAGISLILAGFLLSLFLEARSGFGKPAWEILAVALHTLQFISGYALARYLLAFIRRKMKKAHLKGFLVCLAVLCVSTVYFIPMGNTVNYRIKEEDRVITVKNYKNARVIWKYLRNNLGCSRAAASGVLGNMFAESEYTPDIIEGNGVGHGIGQWSWDRWYGDDGLEIYAQNKGKNWDDIRLQLSFLRHEIVENDSMDVYYDGGFSRFRRLKEVDGEEGSAKVFFSSFEYGNYVSYDEFVSDDFEALYATRSKRLKVAQLIFADKRRFP